MKDQGRTLSKAEQKRKEQFDIKVEELAKEGYEKSDLTIGVVKANILAVIIAIPVIILMVVIYLAVNPPQSMLGGRLNLVFTPLIFILLTVLHELIHGATWAIFAKEHFKSISFGVIWAMLTPYCTCNELLKKWQYIIGAIMPTIFVGFLPAVFAILYHNPTLLFISMIMVAGGGGDAIIATKLLMYRPKSIECMYMDHPYECGMVVFEKK